MKNAIAIALLAGLASVSAADVQVTEIYAGISGEDGTPDWFEITWNGVGTFDTAGLYYDDDSADPAVNAQLSSIILNSGDVAIFLISNDVADFALFADVWGTVANIGLVDGSGLGQGGDAVNLFDGNTAGANLLASAAYPAFNDNFFSTWDFTSGSATASVLGVNGAYESNAFFNDNVGGPNNEVTLIGSPGVIPTPGSIALLGLAGAIISRRRR